MKIIHCADLHLDSKMETNFTTRQARERRYEILDTFERMIAYAHANDVAVIMIAGDMFDTPQAQQKTIKNRVLDAISGADQIDFLYLQGNHDHDEYFRQLEPKPANLKLFGDQWHSYRYDNIVISGREFSSTNQNMDSPLALEKTDFNIVMLHGQVTNYIVDNKAQTINLAQFKNNFIDYLALGHIHQAHCEKLDSRGSWCYPGCLEGRGFDECGLKGFYLLEVIGANLTKEFVSLAKRTFHEIKVDVRGLIEAGAINQAVARQVENIAPGDIVKVVLTGAIEEETELDLDYLLHKLEREFYFAKLVNATTRKIDYGKYANDISLKGEFIRKVQALELSEEEKNQIIMMGINAIMAKEVTS